MLTGLVITFYLIFQLAVVIYISRKIETDADYFVGGRSFGVFIVSISLFATWFGAETCIGSSGAVYADGISGSRADPFGYSLCLFFSGLLITKIWNSKYFTLSDFYNERFGNHVGMFATWVLVLSSIIWAAAQLRAFGQVLSATTSFDLDYAIPLGLLFIMIYTLFGGLMGDMVTDVIQAIVIGIGLLTLFFVVVVDLPPIDVIVKNMEATRWSLMGENESFAMRLDRWAIPVLGSLVAQEIVSRILSAKSRAVATKACYFSGFVYLFFGMIPVLLGMIGPQIIDVTGDSEQFIFQLAESKMGPVFLGVFSGAIISALLATIDSILLAASALISNNFVVPLFKVTDEKKKLKIGRVVIVIAGLVAYFLAVNSTSIFDLLEEASSFGTAGILVITIMGLWSNLGNQKTAFITLLIGIIATPIGDHVLKLESPFLFSIGVSLIFFLGSSLITGNLMSITQES